MNGFLGEEGTFGYLAQSAGGVRKQAKYIKAANPVRYFFNSKGTVKFFSKFLKTVFENSNFLPLKIAFKKICHHRSIYGRNF